MIRFAVVPLERHRYAVEVWDDLTFVAALYPGNGDDPKARAVRMCSCHDPAVRPFEVDPEGGVSTVVEFRS